LEEGVRTVDPQAEWGHPGWVAAHKRLGHHRGSLAGRQGWITMEGLRHIALIALIIALALYLLVILGFGAYSIFLLAKWLIESAASFGLVW
jgi:hypothetical protein